MKKKLLVCFISVLLLACLSVPVFAGPAPAKFVNPEYKSGGLFWLWHYEQITYSCTDMDFLFSYTIRTKDKDGKKLDEKSESNLSLYKRKSNTFKTASSLKAKSGYYNYKMTILGFGTVYYSASGTQP